MIISNTTPLINFAEIGRLDLLFEMFGRIAVPLAVVAELGENVGTIGCLIEAKSRGLISQVEPYIRHSARFWISDQLKNAVLRDAGEL